MGLGSIAVDVVEANCRPLYIDMASEQPLQIGVKRRSSGFVAIRSTRIVFRCMLEDAPESDVEVDRPSLLILKANEIVEQLSPPRRIGVGEESFERVHYAAIHVYSTQAGHIRSTRRDVATDEG